MAVRQHSPKGAAGRRASTRGTFAGCSHVFASAGYALRAGEVQDSTQLPFPKQRVSTQLPFPKPLRAARDDCSWRAQKQHQQKQQLQQQRNWHNMVWYGYANKQPRVLRANNSWLTHSRDPCDLAGYGVAMHEQLRRKLSNRRWQHHCMIVSVPRTSASSGAESIELQPRRRREKHAPCKRVIRCLDAVREDEVRAEHCVSKDKHHRRAVAEAVRLVPTQLGAAANALATLAPELAEAAATKAAEATPKQQQPLVKEHVQQARHSTPSKETKKLPESAPSQETASHPPCQMQQQAPSNEIKRLSESAPSQETAGQSDNQTFAVGVQIKREEPKLFDMTLNDYGDYETDFFPGSCDVTTDDSGCLSS